MFVKQKPRAKENARVAVWRGPLLSNPSQTKMHPEWNQVYHIRIYIYMSYTYGLVYCATSQLCYLFCNRDRFCQKMLLPGLITVRAFTLSLTATFLLHLNYNCLFFCVVCAHRNNQILILKISSKQFSLW